MWMRPVTERLEKKIRIEIAYGDIVEFDCSSVNQAGFYADPNYGCQVFHRCDINGRLSTSLLCVSLIFNQITLVRLVLQRRLLPVFAVLRLLQRSLYHKDWKLFDETAAAGEWEVTTDATEATTVITSTTESATFSHGLSHTHSVTDPTVSATSTLSSVATTASDAEVPTTTVV
ncbi:hypothetical protein BV898_18215 [Hypsibius exemplaris]|uniref:Uncharacterized protein n=1 Tax=Hypsibius exemplaris TaxID=2072580 RepID=A0A9X6RMV2_HYPEX|nr:hypothetical protein BV898_18215 [Hypsibius exemplaris]